MPATTVADVLAALGRFAPWDKAFGWDPVGLQLGDPAAPAGRVAVCHEVTEQVVAAVEDGSAGLLVTYHPLLFRPTTRLVAGRSPAGRAWRLARAGVALAVAHTNFDAAPGGTADALAQALGLEAVTGFGPVWGADSATVVTFVPAEHADAVTAAMAAAGAGRVGNSTACAFRAGGIGTSRVGEAGEPDGQAEVRVEMVAPAARVDGVVAALVAAHPADEPAYDVYERRGDAGFVGRVGDAGRQQLAALAATVRAACGGVLRVAGDPAADVARVAVVPGAGSDYAAAARGAGADVLVTGDVTHHRARAALDRGLAVVDPGHAPSERPGVRNLYAAVRDAAGDAADLTGPDASPWHETET